MTITFKGYEISKAILGTRTCFATRINGVWVYGDDATAVRKLIRKALQVAA
jgi:hypothetical protein